MTDPKKPIQKRDVIPDLADRTAKSLQLSGLSVQDMTELLGCHRNSVSNWLNRRANPFPATLMIWAERTGVSYEWLRDGHWPANGSKPLSQVNGG